MIIQDMSLHGRVGFHVRCDVDAGMATALSLLAIYKFLIKLYINSPMILILFLPIWLVFLLLLNGMRGLWEAHKISVRNTRAC